MVLSAPTVSPPVNPEILSPELHQLLRVIASCVTGSYLVGGAMRDLLLGVPPADVDVMVPGNTEQASKAIASALGGVSFALDAARGQHRVTLTKAGGIVRQIDVSPIEGSVDADLRSRDYTINAMAAPIFDDGFIGELIDPTGGLADLQDGIIRLITVEALRDDPLRLLRAARLATLLEFEVDPATAGTIVALAPLLASSAAERQREELTRILASPRAAKGVRLMDRLGLLNVVLPELGPAKGVEQPGEHHYYDVFEHSVECLAVLDALVTAEPTDDATGILKMREAFDDTLDWYPMREYLDSRVQNEKRLVLLKLAGLLHDVSKPETKSVEPSGKIRFLGHPEQGATKAEAICRRLRFGNDEAAFVSLLVEEHLRPTMLSKPGEPPSRRALYRFFRDLGAAGPACLVLMLADGAAAAGPRLTRHSWLQRTTYVSYLLERYDEISRVEEQAPRLLTGNDLIYEFAMKPGPELGRLLGYLDEAIGAGDITSREEAIEYARVLLSAPEERQDG